LNISKTGRKMLIAGVAVVAILFVLRIAIRAQGTELLKNTTFDQYYGIGGANVAPVGWSLTASLPVSAARQEWVFNEFPGFGASWEVSTSKAVFTMTAAQFVPGIRAGTPLRFQAYSNVFTCDKETSCIEGNVGYRISMTNSNARTRIGVDPTGGQDPNASTVVWSPYISPFDRFELAIVDVQAKTDNGVTLFLNGTQDVGMLLNKMYWDNASLQVLGPGGGAPPGATEVPRVVPFVTPAGQQADGSIIHTVRSGDTLASIAVAYKITIDEIRQLNEMAPDEYVIQIGQKLIIRPPFSVKPPVTYIIVTATYTPGVGTIYPTPTPTFTPTRTPTANSSGPIIIIITVAPTATPVSMRQESDPAAMPFARPRPNRSGGTGQQAKDAGILCAVVFEDADENGYRSAGESPLRGTLLKLTLGTGNTITRKTEGDDPICFADLAPGVYRVAAEPPPQYSVTTPREMRVEVDSGGRVGVIIGAAAGVKAHPVMPNMPAETTESSLTAVFRRSGGVILIGTAGLIVIAGIGVAVLTRA